MDPTLRPEDLEALVPAHTIEKGWWHVATSLYRLHDADGRLLYVGITADPRKCFANHAGTTRWWSNVDTRLIEWHPTRWHAETAEIIAIKNERPMHNQHHARRPLHQHRNARRVIDEIRASRDPGTALRSHLADQHLLGSVRQVLAVAYLDGTLGITAEA